MGTDLLLIFLFLFLFPQFPHFSFSANSTLPPCVEAERQALLFFKASLFDPSNTLSSWTGIHCCRWDGIACDKITGHVLKLHLRNPCSYPPPSWPPKEEYVALPEKCHQWSDSQFSLQAPNVSSSLLHLEYLTHLDLSGNDFSRSPIPTFFGSMRRLKSLSLAEAGFRGRIPSSLGNLKNLRHLDLRWNFGLEGNDMNWMSELESLEHLDMSGVHLGDTHNLFQVLNMLPSLLRIYLRDCELYSPLNISLVNLTKVQVLDLGFNRLTLPVLHAFQNMTSIVDLDLSENPINGPIPDAFKNFTSIQFLYLSDNNITSIPSWFCNFEKLVRLDLSYNGLSGPVPNAFQNMPSIKFLDLSGNHLTLIPSWFHNFKKLQLLDLSCNAEMDCSSTEWWRYSDDLSLNWLNGSKLDAYRNTSSLVYLDLSRNGFSGPIPDGIKNLTSIQALYLRGNNYSSVPSWFQNFKKLLQLDLSMNMLHGPIPDAFRNLTSIEYLDLSLNNITSIPSWFVELKSLVHVHLGQNKLTLVECSLSSILRNMCHLKSFSLSENKLGGEPFGHDELSGCTAYDLEELDLSNNEFSGSLPTWLGQLESLESLDLSNNAFNGPIPQSLQELKNLRHLDLSSNKLDRMVSMAKEWSAIMPQLWHLNLSHNQISGSLPENIGHIMPNLGTLILGNNLINGPIPISLCKAELRNLDLSKNNLSGEIPNCWNDNIEWEEINLSSNKLSGVFPSSFGNLSSLLWLHLNDNNLQGRLPVSFGDLKQLLILDLGENQLSGSIPSWTRNTFPSLQILRLRQNMLRGVIPSQLCQLTSLQILDLSRNKLEGSIPQCIGNLEGMTLNNSSHQANEELVPIAALAPAEAQWLKEDVKEIMKGTEFDYIRILKLVVNMDFSENNLIGIIPDGITWLSGLHGLNLSNNHLEGKVPKNIGDMKSLESFDVSNNHLRGEIPNSMSSLTSLSHLNLSHNNFSGPIPKDNQFLTLDDPSIYAYNPYLCGSPLPNKCPGDRVTETTSNEDDDDKKEKAEELWFFLVVAVGFATGLWGVIGALWFKKSFRRAIFGWVEEKADEIYVATVLNKAKLKKLIVMRNRVQG